jgi:hypothetical protein
MRGYPRFNGDAFEYWAETLREAGYEVFSPRENSIKLFGKAVYENADGDEGAMGGDEEHISRTVFAIDCHWICTQAHAVALIKGWEKSRGASAESAVGLAIPMLVLPVEEYI